MARRLTRILIVLIVALAMALPVAVRAMPAPIGAAGFALHVSICPNPDRAAANPVTVPACQITACISSVAILPDAARPVGRALMRAAYPTALSARWTMFARAPDPFPPRSIDLG
ncbi:hypothetical protein [Lichenicoccus sp.]|uniref:hypothetical protein n=1 Tax=Lichenicoccus sp. TaxID=2781899 RepID=UPI003D0E17C9